jgi:threonine dehydrogenase-like Zn-dependent dehydrogenase
MLRVTLLEPGRFVAEEAPPPRAAEGEAIVRIRRIGICGTDLHAYGGDQPFFRYPRVLGHELSGEIEAVGPNERGLTPGDRVAVEPYVACGSCRTCRAGRYNCCANLQVIGVHRDGGMQERFAAPVSLLHKSESLSLEQLALVETLGIGHHAVERAGLAPGEWVVVVGAGPIGLSVIQFAKAAGVRIIVVDVSPARLEFCRSLGVEHTVEAGSGALEAVAAVTGPDLADCVFDATGSLKAMGNSLYLAGPGARAVMVGLGQGAFEVDDPLFHRRELTLLATRNSAGAFPPIIRMIEEGRIDTSPWITHQLDLAELPAEFGALLAPGSGVIKAMVRA